MMIPATTIVNVRVFDGNGLSGPRTVSIVDGRISEDSVTGETIDGHGGTLLPGLIDSHIHLSGIDNLKQSAHWGVTTMLDMGTRPPQLVESLRGLRGLTDIRSPQSPASAPGGLQTTKMGFDLSTAVTGPNDAERFVAERVAERADYIKIIVEDPSVMGSAALDGPTIAALVQAAHKRSLRVFAHVTSVRAFHLATGAGVDVLTHAPLDAPLDAETVSQIAAAGILAMPTLVMMQAVADLRNVRTHPGSPGYHNATATVTALHRAKVPVLAGTDANDAAASPCKVKHGAALHDELSLLVAAGLTPVDALRGATVLPAKLFDLGDRGTIEPGRRADLVLVDGDPTIDISAIRAIQAA